MAIKHLDNESFESEVLKGKGLVLVDFYADWCGPCKMLAPVFEELSKENGGVKFVKVNTDENNELASHFDINSIPCVIVFKDGAEVDRIIGLRPKEDFQSRIDSY